MSTYVLPGPTLAEGLSYFVAVVAGTTRVVSSPAAAESARALHECEVAS